jgi:hypothetical protein
MSVKGLGRDITPLGFPLRDQTHRSIKRYRLTFFYENRRFRLVVDEAGNPVQRSTVDFGDRPLPASMRKPSA